MWQEQKERNAHRSASQRQKGQKHGEQLEIKPQHLKLRTSCQHKRSRDITGISKWRHRVQNHPCSV